LRTVDRWEIRLLHGLITSCRSAKLGMTPLPRGACPDFNLAVAAAAHTSLSYSPQRGKRSQETLRAIFPESADYLFAGLALWIVYGVFSRGAVIVANAFGAALVAVVGVKAARSKDLSYHFGALM
jgi:hypothetical protein